MNKSLLLRVCIGTLFALYPFVIYFGLQKFQPFFLAMLLLGISAVRVLFTRPVSRIAIFTLIAALLVLGLTLLTRESLALYLYPMLVNLSLFVLFVTSLINPPSLIEQIARRQHGKDKEFSCDAERYTRKVTVAWSIFFLCNGVLSVVTLRVSEQTWVVYNGFIAYLLIALMLTGEYLIRRKVMVSHGY